MKWGLRTAILVMSLLGSPHPSWSDPSVARKWNEALLQAIRRDLARPTVTARNLFHFSIAAYDAWAVFDSAASTYLLGKTVGITVREALEGIVGLKHFDEDATPTSALSAGDIATSFSTRIVNGVRVLWRVRDVSKELGTPLRQWEVLTPDGIAAHNSNFLERVISPQNGAPCGTSVNEGVHGGASPSGSPAKR